MSHMSSDAASSATERVPLALIVAMARNRVIGKDNAMPWHLPAELKRFKQLTMAKPILMGRKTHESIGRVLPGRPNIVVSAREPVAELDGLYWVNNLDDALSTAEREAKRLEAEEIMVIGGAQIYSALLPQITTLYITEIDLEPEGDAFFPAIDGDQWVLEEESPGQQAADGAPAWRTLRYKRRSND